MYRDELAAASRIAIEAGDIVRGYFGRELRVDMKGFADPVTAADRAAEAHIRAELTKQFPDDALYGEEEGRESGRSGRTWIIDPLDGTANFAGGMPLVAVCLTLIEGENRPVLNVTYDPIKEEMFDAVRGGGARLDGIAIHVSPPVNLASALIHLNFPRDRHAWLCNLDLVKRVTAVAPHGRNIGSSALAQAYVACGRLNGHVRVSAGDFDIVGGNLMIEEAGGLATNLNGDPYDGGENGLCTAGKEMHALLMGLDLGAALRAGDCD